MTEATIYLLIGYVVGMVVGHAIGRRRGIEAAMKAARAEIAKMQGEKLKEAEKRLQESLDRIKQPPRDPRFGGPWNG